MSNLRKLIFVAAAILSLAFAGWGQGNGTSRQKSGTAHPGEINCTEPLFANIGVELNGDTTPHISMDKWKIRRSDNLQGPFTETVEVDNVPVAHVEILKKDQPKKFPGYFRACMLNTGNSNTKYTVQIQLEGD